MWNENKHILQVWGNVEWDLVFFVFEYHELAWILFIQRTRFLSLYPLWSCSVSKAVV